MPVIDRFMAFQRHRSFLPVLYCSALLLFVLGYYLTFVRPGHLVEDARAEAETEVQNARASVEEVQGTLDKMAWFKKSYTESASTEVANARQLIESGDESATAYLVKADSGSWRTRYGCCEDAKHRATDANAKARQALDQLRQALARKNDAAQKLTTLNTAWPRAQSTVQAIERRIAGETPRYPTRYGRELVERRKTIAQRLDQLAPTLPNTGRLMPSEGTNGSGDPDAALVLLVPALASTASAEADAAGVIASLDTLKSQADQAQAKVLESEAETASSAGKLSADKRRTGFRLTTATDQLGAAEAKVLSARSLLTAKAMGETVADLPLAYVTALEAIAKARSATQEAANELALAERARAAKDRFASKIGDFRTLAGQCILELAIISTRHHSDAWKEYHSIGTRFGAARSNEYNDQLRTVNLLLGLEEQKFAEAERLANSGIESIEAARVLSAGFLALVQELERLRTSYGGEYDTAKRALDAERANIVKYGSADSSAKSAFDDGERALQRASSLSSERRYKDAVAEAKRAYDRAHGTGAKAKSTFERKQREDEEEEEREAERKRKAARERNNPSGGSTWTPDRPSSPPNPKTGSEPPSKSGSDSKSKGGSDSKFKGGSDGKF